MGEKGERLESQLALGCRKKEGVEYRMSAGVQMKVMRITIYLETKRK